MPSAHPLPRLLRQTLVALTTLSVLLGAEGAAQAYVGPGAGFAVITSAFFAIAAMFVVFFSLLLWPLRYTICYLRRRKAQARSRSKRVVILGLDGLDPRVVRELLDQGKLPHFATLMAQGKFAPLGTSRPPLSPVAWTSFMTGTNPGRNNIYDFLARDPRTYLPVLSSARISGAKRSLKLGKYTLPLGKPIVQNLRKSKPFWHILGEHGVFSTVIRVPITFPAERFNGLLLSGMCVPDLRGSQGTFSFYSTGADGEATETTGGMRVRLKRQGAVVQGALIGPPDTMRDATKNLEIPFRATVEGDGATLVLPDQTIALCRGAYSPWIQLRFPAGLGIKVSGIARFLLTETAPEFKLYVTPINIDPEKPALPISHPYSYAVYLAKMFGPYATLGLAEDTWALNEGVIDDQAFLDQAYLYCAEREEMLFDGLEKNKRGLLVCVFDTTDRIQHMFWRYRNAAHPALAGGDRQKFAHAIEELYLRMDGLLGRLSERLEEDDALIVMSDHGFCDFSRGVNLNTWLEQNGYLALKSAQRDGQWLTDVDWQKTRAYAVGFGGIYLNLKGREGQGIVEAKDSDALKKEIIGKLAGLRDEPHRRVAVMRVWDRAEVYHGPYLHNAPDLIVGFGPGYRVSWDCAQGRVAAALIEDNTRAWSGDHCVEPSVVPGILFTSFKHGTDAPQITDLAPTVLELLGVPAPRHLDGKCLEGIALGPAVPASEDGAPVAQPDAAAARVEGTA